MTTVTLVFIVGQEDTQLHFFQTHINELKNCTETRMRCLLSLKFGKDIAGLVNWWAWKIGLTSVHEEIASTFKCTS